MLYTNILANYGTNIITSIGITCNARAIDSDISLLSFFCLTTFRVSLFNTANASVGVGPFFPLVLAEIVPRLLQTTLDTTSNGFVGRPIPRPSVGPWVAEQTPQRLQRIIRSGPPKLVVSLRGVMKLGHHSSCSVKHIDECWELPVIYFLEE